MFRNFKSLQKQLFYNPLYKFSEFGDTKFIILFGAPGVGKGTYAKLLKKDLKYNHISTGDEIRKIIKGQAASTFSKSLIAEIKSIVNSGKLVSDDIVLNILKEKLKEPASKKGVILDGIPRTISQCEKFEQAGIPTDLVVNIYLNFSVLLEKLMGRRVCNKCGQNYNICAIYRDGYEMDPLLPKKEGVCDVCGSTDLIIRADDNEDIITKRMTEYEEKTKPLLEIYQNKGVVLDFEAKRGVKDYPRLLELVKPKL